MGCLFSMLARRRMHLSSLRGHSQRRMVGILEVKHNAARSNRGREKYSTVEKCSSESLGLVFESIATPADVSTVLMCGFPASQPPALLCRFTNLSSLIITYCECTNLPWSIVYLQQLHELNLSHNRFTDFPRPVLYLTSLTHLLISSNQLTSLPVALTDLQALVKLDVSDNPHLVAPPVAVCEQGVEAIFKHLRTTRTRSNLWENYHAYVTDESSDIASKPRTLQDFCIKVVLEHGVQFSTMPVVLRKHLQEEDMAFSAAVRLAKCSQCLSHFSTQASFARHVCKDK